MKLSTPLVTAAAVLMMFSSAGYAQDSGDTLFQSRCQMCHGPDGKGDTPTGKAFHVPNLHDPAVAKMTDDDLKNVITKGKNKMPAFGTRLTPPQIDSLVAYIRTMQKQ
ncbi:MAG TPA: cytochrome c [Acidobacteriaceae bacterium]|nr:cytochrome c [Acidobacteriaceae bacterium]